MGGGGWEKSKLKLNSAWAELGNKYWLTNMIIIDRYKKPIGSHPNHFQYVSRHLSIGLTFKKSLHKGMLQILRMFSIKKSLSLPAQLSDKFPAYFLAWSLGLEMSEGGAGLN